MEEIGMHALHNMDRDNHAFILNPSGMVNWEATLKLYFKPGDTKHLAFKASNGHVYGCCSPAWRASAAEASEDAVAAVSLCWDAGAADGTGACPFFWICMAPSPFSPFTHYNPWKRDRDLPAAPPGFAVRSCVDYNGSAASLQPPRPSWVVCNACKKRR